MLVFSVLILLVLLSTSWAGPCLPPVKGYEYSASEVSYDKLFSPWQVNLIRKSIDECNSRQKSEISRIKNELSKLSKAESVLSKFDFGVVKERIQKLSALLGETRGKLDKRLSKFSVVGLYAVVIDADRPLTVPPSRLVVPAVYKVAVPGLRDKLKKALLGYNIPGSGGVVLERTLYDISQFYGGGFQFVGLYIARVYPCGNSEVREGRGSYRAFAFDMLKRDALGKLRAELHDLLSPEVAETSFANLKGLAVMWRSDLESERDRAFRELLGDVSVLASTLRKVEGSLKDLRNRLAYMRKRLLSLFSEVGYSCPHRGSPELCIAPAKAFLATQRSQLLARLRRLRSYMLHYGEGTTVGEVVKSCGRGLAIGKIWVYPFRDSSNGRLKFFVVCSVRED